jgi:predicted nucleic acid-binding protein
MSQSDGLFIDTAGWACFLDRDNLLHQDAVRLYQQAAAGSGHIITTNYVLTELVALLSSRLRLPRATLIETVDGLQSAPRLEIVHITPEVHAAAWALLKARLDKEWSWVDAASFVVMTNRGITVALTTDHHFEQAGFARLLTPHN